MIDFMLFTIYFFILLFVDKNAYEIFIKFGSVKRNKDE